jgi:hypothetical protein
MTSPSKLRFGKELDALKISDIQLLIDNRIDESQNLEYKQPSTKLNDECNRLSETISGFLNTDGGIIVYGISELKDKTHSFPDKVIWTRATKETLESLLVSRIHPWAEGIRIHRIQNKENPEEGIFVIEVPKSPNPPHMCNYAYYQRLNYQTQPMEHESVYRAFQTNYVRRTDLLKQVIQPLYSEIRFDCRCILNFKYGNSNKYNTVVSDDAFLYDQLELSTRREIDKFYKKMEQFSGILVQVNKTTTTIINEEIAIVVPSSSSWIGEHIKEDLLSVWLSLRNANGNVEDGISVSIREALLKRESLRKHVQSIFPYHEIINISPSLNQLPSVLITESTFLKIWRGCEQRVKKDEVYLLMWKERLELHQIGNNILTRMKN